jgi:tetratricopeptide (TPR) repeat protein
MKSNQKIRLVVVAAVIALSIASVITADTQVSEQDQGHTPTSGRTKDEYLQAVAEARKLVDAGQATAAKKTFAQVKKDFGEIAGPDFDVFTKAELFYCKGKFTKASIRYNKLLTEFENTEFYDAALGRQFTIAKAFLAGRKKKVLIFFRISGYAEGISIMEHISDWAGLDDPNGIGLQAAVATAESYEKFKLLYPEDAQELSIDKIITEINEQLARKQLSIAKYYQKIGKRQAANLYCDMIIRELPDTEAAQTARKLLDKDSLPQGQEK